jgi:hypothetical protein
MNFKIITAASAIVLGMAFAGPSFAETMLGGVAVADSDLPKVQEKCDTLNTATSLSTDSTTSAMPNSSSTESATPAAGATAGVATGAATSLNVDAITIEQCKDAGLVK